jgi:hypothetical protein
MAITLGYDSNASMETLGSQCDGHDEKGPTIAP